MTTSINEFIVPWVRDSAPYSDKHMDFAWEHPAVMRMMSNENPLPPSETVLMAIRDAACLGNLYPGSGADLRRALAKPVGLSADNVALGNGSTDVINFVLHAFVSPGDEVIVCPPTFAMYETRARLHGAIPIFVPMTPDFTWDIDEILKAITDRTKLIFICTPNNPTGNQIPEPDLRRILEAGVPTVIDEAYYELENYPETFAYLLQEYPNAIVNRTMSKAFGLAGLRLGYCFASETLISYFNRTKIPWNVSLLALAAALAALQDEDDQRRKWENNKSGRDYLTAAINAIPGLRAINSEGNFVLIDAGSLGKDSQVMRDELIERGVFVRPMSPHHMQPGFIRVTVGTGEQNREFVEILRKYVAEVSQARLT